MRHMMSWCDNNDIYCVVIYVETVAPGRPGKRNPHAHFEDSHGSVANFGINKCQIYNKHLI